LHRQWRSSNSDILPLLQLEEDHADQNEPARVVEWHVRKTMGIDWSALPARQGSHTMSGFTVEPMAIPVTKPSLCILVMSAWLRWQFSTSTPIPPTQLLSHSATSLHIPEALLSLLLPYQLLLITIHNSPTNDCQQTHQLWSMHLLQYSWSFWGCL